MSSKQTMKNQLNEMFQSLSGDEFPVDGWHFTIDDDSKFNPFCLDAATKAGFPFREGMPMVEKMFYFSQEYSAYLQVPMETDTQHPANIEKLEWVAYDNPPLETI